jgi:hypothetical protein
MVVGVNYILEVVEQVCDCFALRIGQDIIVVDFRSVGRAAEEQLSTEVAHCVGRGLASRRCRGGPSYGKRGLDMSVRVSAGSSL